MPEPETKKYLDQFVNSDIQRDKDYQELKQIIDEYHKDYIEKSLSSENILKSKDLKQIYNFLCKSRKIQLHTKKEEIQKEIDKKQKQLRSDIVKCFKESLRDHLNFYYCRSLG